MAGIIHAAAQRINTSTAGVTGPPSHPLNEPGARLPASPAEVLASVPTEFGDLTGLFGGEPLLPTGTIAAGGYSQFAPVNTGLERVAGSVPGALGGLVPDVRTTTNNAVETAKEKAAPTVAPLIVTVQNTIARARKALGL